MVKVLRSDKKITTMYKMKVASFDVADVIKGRLWYFNKLNDKDMAVVCGLRKTDGQIELIKVRDRGESDATKIYETPFILYLATFVDRDNYA